MVGRKDHSISWDGRGGGDRREHQTEDGGDRDGDTEPKDRLEP